MTNITKKHDEQALHQPDGVRDKVYSYFRGRKLQSCYMITIRTTDLPEDQQYHDPGTTKLVTTRKVVFFHSRIHKNPVTSPTFSWSGTWSDQDILKDSDLLKWVYDKYGNVWAL